MSPLPPPPGVILAGGRSTRMGGGDKALLRLGDRRIIDHVLGRIAPQCGALAIGANGDPARFADLGRPVLPDRLPDGVPDWPGPLAGVLAAMDWAAGLGTERVVTVPSDTPFLPTDLVARLMAAGGRGAIAAGVAADRVSPHPTCAIWPVARRGALRLALAKGLRRMSGWTGPEGMATVGFAAHPVDPFFNVNTPEDLSLAEMRLAATPL